MGSAIRINNVPSQAYLSFMQYGQCVQDGVPSPSTPAPISGKAAGGKVYGKNLLPFPYSSSSGTINGVTCTANEDGSIVLNGTAAADVQFNVRSANSNFVLQAGGYRLSGCPAGGSSASYRIFADRYSGTTYAGELGRDYGSGAAINLTQAQAEAYNIRIGILVKSGTVANNLTFRPQLELSPAVTVYEPCKTAQTITVQDADNNGVTLYGIPVSSGGNVTIDGQQYIADTVDSAGVLTRRVGVMVLDGTENVAMGTAFGSMTAFSTNLPKPADTSVNPILNTYPGYTSIGVRAGDKLAYVGANIVRRVNTDYASVDAYKTWEAATPTYLYYVLATPTTEQVVLSPARLPAQSPVSTWVSEAHTGSVSCYLLSPSKRLLLRRRQMMARTNLPPVGTTLEAATWEQIDAVSRAGKAADYWSVGDTKTVAFDAPILGSGSATVAIAGFAHDDLADGSGKAGITFTMVNCFNTLQAMNSTVTNTGGWARCTLRATLQGPSVWGALPGEMTSVIKAVSKTTATKTITEIGTAEDTLFLFSMIEATGYSVYTIEGEGTQYSYYTDSAHQIKTVNAAAHPWWLRSPNSNDTKSFCRISNYGSRETSGATTIAGISVGFCV